MGFEFEIHYKDETINLGADALSRNEGVDLLLLALNLVVLDFLSTIKMS